MSRIPARRITYYSTRDPSVHVTAMQESGSYECFRRVLREGFPLIIEFGTACFGLTLFFHELCPKSEIHSYDRYSPEKLRRRCGGVDEGVLERAKSMLDPDRVTLHQVNLLSFRKGENKQLVGLLRDERRKLLYCDNGNKQLEVNTYSKYLNKGDLLGIHDWNIEVHWRGVRKALLDFKSHPINRENEKNRILSRFFIKR